MLNHFRFLSAFICIACSLLFTTAAEAQKENIVLRALPEKCDLAICWLGAIKPDVEGAAPEKWLAQPEMQQMFSKLKSAIGKYLETNPVGDEMAQTLMSELPWIMMQQPWAIYAPSLDDLRKPPENFAVLLKLGENEKTFKQLIAENIATENSETKKIMGSNFYVLPPRRDFPKLVFGIHKNYFMFGIGENSIDELFKNAKSPAPKWTAELQKRIPVDRLGGLMHVSISPFWKSMQQQQARQWEMIESAGLDDITGMEGVMGIRNDQMLTHGTLKCSNNPDSLLSLFGANPIADKDLKQIPDTADSAIALNLGTKVFWNVVEKVPPAAQAAQQFDFMLGQLAEGMTVKQLFDKHLTGYLLAYGAFDLVNPTANTMLGIGVQDVENLRPKFEQVMEQLGTDEFGQNVETKETNGVKIFTVSAKPGRGGSGMPQCFCLTDDYLYFGLNPRAITSHLRKAKRETGKLIERSELQVLFDDNKNAGLGRPIGIQYLDIGKSLQLLSSVTPMVAPFLANEGFDFDITKDIPSGDVLAKNVMPDCMGIYRNDDGIHFVEHHTAPGITSIGITGIGIGMLLPAVQQVRGASRRVQSMNNMRQMVLASLNYESSVQRMPPAYSANEEGEKLLSWRVHLLPFFGQNQLYEKFKLDEPWDSPHNKELIAEMPEIFGNPNLALQPGYTTYLGVTGKNAVFTPPQEGGIFKGTIGLASITDGTSNTIQFVEANQQNAVPWTKPTDLDIDQVQDLLGACRGVWPGRINIALCDGSCHSIAEEQLDNKKLRLLMTRNDGERVDFDR